MHPDIMEAAWSRPAPAPAAGSGPAAGTRTDDAGRPTVSSSDILERPDTRESDTGSANEVFHYVR